MNGVREARADAHDVAQHRGCAYGPERRLKKRCDFLRLTRAEFKVHTKFFVANISKREAGPARLGLTVSRKVGSSPERNRIKRLAREVFRKMEWPGVDLVLIAKSNRERQATYADVAADLDTIRKRVLDLIRVESQRRESTPTARPPVP